MVATLQGLRRELLLRSKEILVPVGFPSEDPFYVFDLMLMDDPGLMHVDCLREMSSADGETAVLEVRYHPDNLDIPGHRKAMEDAFLPLAKKAGSMPYAQRAELVSDWLLDRATLVEAPLEHTVFAWSPIEYGLGTADAFIRAWLLAARAAGLTCAPAFAEDETWFAWRYEHPWIDVFEPALDGRPSRLLGCVDIVGAALAAQAGKRACGQLLDEVEVLEECGRRHAAVSTYRKLKEGQC